MGNRSVISGYIVLRDREYLPHAKQTIDSYDFDALGPFTNIFWCDSPAQYFFPIIGIAGSYKQIEEVWSEWMWKFSKFLSQLEGVTAWVNLDCVIGNYRWELKPKAFCSRNERPESVIGQDWVIARAPGKDFSIDPRWLAQVEQNLWTVTGKYKWDKFVERLPVAME